MSVEPQSGSAHRELLPSQRTGGGERGETGGVKGGETGGAEREAEGRGCCSPSDESPHNSLQTEERPPQSGGAANQGEEDMGGRAHEVKIKHVHICFWTDASSAGVAVRHEEQHNHTVRSN